MLLLQVFVAVAIGIIVLALNRHFALLSAMFVRGK
jgi:hypothetical protein